MPQKTRSWNKYCKYWKRDKVVLLLKETWASAHIYQVLIILLFILTSETISKPDTLDATIFPAVPGCGSFDSMYRTQKSEDEKRKTQVRQQETSIPKM